MNESRSLPITEVLVFDGFDDLDAVAPLEILTAAGFPTRVVRPASQSEAVQSAHGLTIQVTDPLASRQTPGLIIVPGGGWLAGAPSGVRAQCGGNLPRVLAQLHDGGAVLASVCTGAMLLAAAGVLTGRPSVTNRMALDDLAATGADLRREARIVDDGDVVTCGGPAAGIDLALRLVGRFAGEPAAANAAERLEHEPVGPVLAQIGVGKQVGCNSQAGTAKRRCLPRDPRCSR